MSQKAPPLSTRSQMQLPNGLPLGLPTSCELGTLNTHGDSCRGEAVTRVGMIRICAKHLRLLNAIAAEGQRDAEKPAPRRPEAQVYRRMAAGL